jgi:hypothetical protein
MPYQRGPWFWGAFSTGDGQRFQVPLKDEKGKRIPFSEDPASPPYQRAVRAEERAKQQAEWGQRVTRPREQFSRLPFSKACEKYLEERRHGLRLLSIRTELERSRSTKAFFAERRVNTITTEDLRAYVPWRKSQKPQHGSAPEVSNRTVNMELALELILK